MLGINFHAAPNAKSRPLKINKVDEGRENWDTPRCKFAKENDSDNRADKMDAQLLRISCLVHANGEEKNQNLQHFKHN